ncbi:MAG: hypothetical protein IH621_12420, partial [Krumholzibacteria bacterium]|nr:hypothetical protein [Candidatus Krumholzibacteria bacterium]
RQLYRYGHGRALMARRYPGSVSPPATLLAGFVLGLVALPVAGIHRDGGRVGAGHVARWRPGRLWAAVASCFSAVHLGAGLGYLVGLAGGPGWRQAAGAATRTRVAIEHAEGAAALAPSLDRRATD